MYTQSVPALISKNVGNTLSNYTTWGGVVYNAKQYGAKGNGETDDYAALTKLINSTINGDQATILFPSGIFKLSSDITFPANISVWFVDGAMLSPNSGKTVTIMGPIDAGIYQIFTGSGTISGSPKVDKFYAQWFGAKGDGVADDTDSLQKAVNAAAGNILFIPAGRYMITSQINILRALTVTCNHKFTTIIMATQNQNGFVIGDGTTETRNVTFSTRIDGLIFVPLDGIAAFTSGSCIYLDFVAYVEIVGCNFYGSDGLGRKLFTAITVDKVINFQILSCYFRLLGGKGISCFGGSTPETLTINGRIDYCEWEQITQQCVYFGAWSQGVTVNFPIMYTFDDAGIQVDGNPSTEQCYNFFIEQPDIELDGPTSRGIYVPNGANVNIVGGWIGANTGVGNTAIEFASGSHSCLAQSIIINNSIVVVDAQFCTISDCDISGDASTTQDGIAVGGNSNKLIISDCRIRQWTRYGINIQGTPNQVNITGCSFNAIGTIEINSTNNNPNVLSPQSSGIMSDVSFSMTAAANIDLRYGRYFIQITGATPITSMRALTVGYTLTIQAGTGGLNWTDGAKLHLKGATDAVQTQFTIISFICDGDGWFETSRTF
jgi:hypothetical protein